MFRRLPSASAQSPSRRRLLTTAAFFCASVGSPWRCPPAEFAVARRAHPLPAARTSGQALRALAVASRLGSREELSDVDAQAVRELFAAVGSAGLANVPVGLLQRCCREAGNDVDAACARVEDIMHWRAAEKVDRLLGDQAALRHEAWYRRLLHYGLPGRDRSGRALMIEAIGRWDMGAIDRAASERRGDMLRAHTAVCERLLAEAARAAAPRADGGRLARRVPGFVAVLDMDGVSLRQNPLTHPNVLRALREVSRINARYYPGAVEHVFVVNAPLVFRQLWKLIAPFVMPDDGVKVDVLQRGDVAALVDECGRDCLPVQLGGRLPASTPPYQAADSAEALWQV